MSNERKWKKIVDSLEKARTSISDYVVPIVMDVLGLVMIFDGVYRFRESPVVAGAEITAGTGLVGYSSR